MRQEAAQLGFDLACGGPDRARLKKYNAYFTPQGATRILLRTLRDDLGIDPAEWKDPQAGAGVFGWAGAEVWPDACSRAVEIRGEEAAHLAHNYDQSEIADYLELPVEEASTDAIITNPSFEDALQVADKGLQELREGGWLGLLLRLTWGDNAKVSAWLRKHPPVACVELDGRLAFAVGINPASGEQYQEDSVTYRMPLWRKGAGRLTASGAIDYERYLKLTRLADEDRTWLRVAGQPVRPGTEYLHGL